MQQFHFVRCRRARRSAICWPWRITLIWLYHAAPRSWCATYRSSRCTYPCWAMPRVCAMSTSIAMRIWRRRCALHAMPSAIIQQVEGITSDPLVQQLIKLLFPLSVQPAMPWRRCSFTRIWWAATSSTMCATCWSGRVWKSMRDHDWINSWPSDRLRRRASDTSTAHWSAASRLCPAWTRPLITYIRTAAGTPMSLLRKMVRKLKINFHRLQLKQKNCCPSERRVR